MLKSNYSLSLTDSFLHYFDLLLSIITIVMKVILNSHAKDKEEAVDPPGIVKIYLLCVKFLRVTHRTVCNVYVCF